MSTTVQLPNGHSATLRDPKDMTVRHRRPLQILTSTLGQKRFMEIVLAQAKTVAEAIEELGLTEHEHEILFRMTDATVYGLLESWTLDEPLPSSADDVMDIPGWAMDVLAVETGKVMAAYMAERGTNPNGTPIDPFSVDAADDPSSPTGASAGSNGSSAAGAGRRTSKTTTKRSGGSPRTGTRKRSA